jgi:predicted acyl esterase
MFPLWYPVQVKSVQHGLGKNGKINHNTGEYISGPETLSPEELAANIRDLPAELQKRELIDGYHKDRITDLSKIKVPVLSCGNWGGNALHLRGNIEGYMRAASKQKWLEIHGLEHFTEFYTPYGIALQKRFFDYFLKGMDTWKDQPPVYLRLRKVDGSFKDRAEQEWPLARTQWRKFYLDTQNLALSTKPVKGGKVSFEALGKGLTFLTPPLEEEMEITGPITAKLFVASSTKDADIFLTIRVLDPGGKDVTFVGASDPHNVVGTGWLRASHRKLDPKLSLPYRPWHVHDEKQMLTPGETYELDVEVWPTSVIVPKGYRVGVAVMGKDYELPGDGPWPVGYGVQWKGNALYIHVDPKDRPAEIYGGKTTLTSVSDRLSYLMLPIIPAAK